MTGVARVISWRELSFVIIYGPFKINWVKYDLRAFVWVPYGFFTFLMVPWISYGFFWLLSVPKGSLEYLWFLRVFSFS